MLESSGVVEVTDADIRARVLVTLPVYNEAPRLRASVESVYRTLEQSSIRFTLAIAEDGSTDGSQMCIDELHSRFPTMIVQTNPMRKGRGWALRTLWKDLDYDLYAFSDADFAADPDFLIDAIHLAERGCQIVTGSRYIPGARVVRPPIRRLISQLYNSTVRLVFRESISDHQCGLKVFTRQALQTLLPLSREDTWFWDTEMLVLAAELGVPVTELPVRWIERKVRRTSISRLLADVYLHGAGILRLKDTIRLSPPEREDALIGASDFNASGPSTITKAGHDRPRLPIE